MSALQATWFILIGVLITGYAILDGFDLGVGFWQFFTRRERDRRALLRAISPVWDGNEVWLLTGGGALFAAFPHVYATAFSGFYLALMLVIFALIFRAVAIEFRERASTERWRATWDKAFSIGSSLPALLFGVAVGNVMRGLPLDEAKNYTGSFWGLLNPYALLVGLLGFSMFATHGALYLVLKTEGELAERARRWASSAWVPYLLLYVIASVVTVVSQPGLLQNYRSWPVLWLLPLLALAAIIMAGVLCRHGQALGAFLFSSISIAGLIAVAGASLFPNLIPAANNPDLSLTIMNASSSTLTLKTMLILAALGMPIVLGYTVWSYRVFRGKVSAEEGVY